MKGVSCVNQLSSVNLVTNVTNVAPDLPVGARLIQFWEKWAALGISPNVVTVLKEGYTLPFWVRPNLTRSPNVISCYVNPHRNLYLLEALHQLLNKNAIEPVTNQTSLGLLQPVVSSSQTQQPVETSTGPQQPQQISKYRVIQNGDSRDNKNLPGIRGVGNLDRFQRRILPHTDPEPVKEVDAFSYTGQIIPIQSPTIRPLHSSHGVHCSGQRGQVSCTTKGYKDPPVPRRLVGQSQIPPNLSPAYKDTNIPLSGVRLASKLGEIRTGPQTSIRF